MVRRRLSLFKSGLQCWIIFLLIITFRIRLILNISELMIIITEQVLFILVVAVCADKYRFTRYLLRSRSRQCGTYFVASSTRGMNQQAAPSQFGLLLYDTLMEDYH